MKNGIVLNMVLCFMPFILNAEIVDFDGKSKTRVDSKSFLFEYLPAAPITPARLNGGSSQLTSKIGVFSESGGFVEVQPNKNWFNEKGVRQDYYTFLPETKIWNQVTCTWQDLGAWSAEVHYSYIHDYIAGHNHYTPPPPALNINRNYANTPPDDVFAPAPSPISVPETPVNTAYKFWIMLPKFATRINFQTQPYGSCANQTKLAVIDVRYTYDGGKELQAMTTGQNYFLYSSDNDKKYHPYHGYGTLELNEALKNVADEYRKACPTAGKMEIGDMSLPWGGLYDFMLDWKKGHLAHRTGLNADIRKKMIRKSNRANLLKSRAKN